MAITFEELGKLAVTKKASDLHVVVGEPPVLRIDGVLEVQTDLSIITAEDSQGIFASITTPDQQRILNENRELDFGYATQDGAHFRINLHWERGVIGLVARLIAPNIPVLKDLLMPEICQNILYVKQGLIIMTGPTGSGKSSSLAAMVDYINEERAEHIVTFEDPIEFVFKPKKSIIRQRQLGTDVLSFGEGLKRVLRQDPNVIMVGEIRDLDTMSAVLTLAETGHLVLATLHAPNSVQAIDRIIDLFPPHQQEQVRLSLASVLTAIITKWLVPRVSGGRIPAYEVLINTQPVAGLVRDNKISQIKSFIQTSRNQGMVTMEQAFQQLLKTGEISQETFDASGQ